MKSLKKKIIKFRDSNKYNNEKCSNLFDIELTKLNKFLADEIEFEQEECDRINEIIDKSTLSVGKRIVKYLDLIFRLVAMVMALVTLLLLINENVETRTLIVLLSIGLVCSSMTILPKIEK